MQGIEYNIAAHYHIYNLRESRPLAANGRSDALSCSQTREEGIGFRLLWVLVQYMFRLFQRSCGLVGMLSPLACLG